MLKQPALWRCPPRWRPGSVVRYSPLVKVLENLLDNHRVFHTGDDPDRSFTLFANLNVNVEHPFQSLHPLIRKFRCRGAHGCARTARS